MAWGSFVKKLKGFGNKIVSGVKTGVKFVQDIVLPGAKKFLNEYGDLIPYGEQAKNILNKVDDFTNKADKISKGELPSDVRQWLNSQIRA